MFYATNFCFCTSASLCDLLETVQAQMTRMTPWRLTLMSALEMRPEIRQPRKLLKHGRGQAFQKLTQMHCPAR